VSAQLETLVFRRATVADAGGLAPVLVEGFETFREFSPPDFEPPRVEDAADDLAARLGNPAVWCLLAESSADVAGYVSLLPAAEARRPVGGWVLADGPYFDEDRRVSVVEYRRDVA